MKTLEKECVIFTRNVASAPQGTSTLPSGILKELICSAQKLVDKMCNHSKVKENQYCHLCAWHNEPPARANRHGVSIKTECGNCNGRGEEEIDGGNFRGLRDCSVCDGSGEK